MKSTFSVIYYLKRQVVKKDGTVPVMGRITVDGSQTQFSCKLTVDPKLWDTKGGRVTGRSTAALEANRMLDKMRVRINRHYQEIMERDNFVTAEKVKNAFLGLERSEEHTSESSHVSISYAVFCLKKKKKKTKMIQCKKVSDDRAHSTMKMTKVLSTRINSH